MKMSWNSRSTNKLEFILEKLNRNGESTTFDEEREDQEIRENMRIISISSCPILSANFHVPTFHHVSVSFPHA